MLHQRIVLGTLALLLGAAPALAQQPQPPQSSAAAQFTPSHLQLAREVATLSGMTSSFTGIFDEFAANMKQTVITRPELAKDLDQSLALAKVEANKRIEFMSEICARVFASRYPEADLKEIAAFFNSPVGRRYNSLRPAVVNDIYAQLQPWTFQTSDALFNMVKEDMRKRGHEIGG